MTIISPRTGASESATLDFEIPTEGARTISYLGGKWRVRQQIARELVNLSAPRTRVCDIFSGSGAIAFEASKYANVYASDIQEYSRCLTSALVSPPIESVNANDVLDAATEIATKKTTSSLEELCERERLAIIAADRGNAEALADIVDFGSIFASTALDDHISLKETLRAASSEIEQSADTVITRIYGGVYFSYEQTLEIDALAQVSRLYKGAQRDQLLAALMCAATEIVSTVGSQFAQPTRPRDSQGRVKAGFASAVSKKRKIRTIDLYRRWLSRLQATAAPSHLSVVEKKDFRDALAALPDDAGVIYADPPYTRDHYSRFYHVLETLAVGDEPAISTMKAHGEVRVSRGLYREGRHQSPFSIHSQAPAAFEEIFAAAAERRIPVLVSYSPYSASTKARPRVMHVGEIADLARQHFPSVEAQTIASSSHNKFNAQRLNTEVWRDAELLLTAKF